MQETKALAPGGLEPARLVKRRRVVTGDIKLLEASLAWFGNPLRLNRCGQQGEAGPGDDSASKYSSTAAYREGRSPRTMRKRGSGTQAMPPRVNAPHRKLRHLK